MAAKPAVARPTPVVPDDALVAAAREAGVMLLPALERFGGRADVYLRMYRDFVDNGLDAVHADLQDATEARRQVHSLKGLAATLGIDDLAAEAARVEDDVAASIERGAAVPPGDRLHALVASIAAGRPALRRLLAQLEAAWATPSPRNPPDAAAAAAAPVAPVLRRLRHLLDSADMEALDLTDRLLADHAAALGEAGHRLHEAVHRLDFAGAAALVQSLERMQS